MKGKIRYLMFLLVAAVLLSGCRQKGDPLSLTGLKFQLEVENKFFPRIVGAHHFWFTDGWMAGQKIASAPVSRIRFFHLAPRDRHLLLEIKNPNDKDLKIKVFLNDSLIRELTIDDLLRTELTLPENRLKIGTNFLRFVTGIRDINRGIIRTDVKRKLYFYINNIHFKDPLTFKTAERLNDSGPEKLLQPANSRFRMLLDPAVTPFLDYRFRVMESRKPGRLTVTARGEPDKPLILADLTLHRKKYRGRITLPDLTGPTEVTVHYRSGDKTSFLHWNRLNRPPRRDSTAAGRPRTPLDRTPPVFIIVIDAARGDLTNRKVDQQQTTPNLAEFSRQAIRFPAFYANAPYTIASVATLLSGLLPDTHGVRKMENRLPDRVKTLPHFVAKKGYQSHAVCANVTLFNTDLMRDFENIVICRPFGDDRIKNNSYVDTEVLTKSLTTPDYRRPQLFYIHLLPPHEPYNPPEERFYRFTSNSGYFPHTIRLIKKAERYNIFNSSFTENLRRMYLNNLFYADHLVGEILRTLKDQQLFDRSLIIVTSDHGEAFFEHGKYTHNSTNYDEMIRVPFLVKLPGQQESRVIDHTFSLVDLLPSLVSWLDLPSGDLPGPGIPICLDPSAADPHRRAIYSRAVGKEYNLSLVEDSTKYIFYSGRDELYDLTADPGEKQNLAEKEPLRVMRLKQRVFEILRQSQEEQKQLGIRPVTREQTDRSILRELKALGYL